MANFATTKMSSKGQVVIPEDIRKRLKLKAGSQFVVMGEDDVVILKVISPPTFAAFDSLMAEARRQAKEAGLKKVDIAEVIAKVRNKSGSPHRSPFDVPERGKKLRRQEILDAIRESRERG